jgi:hypothetical protein
MAETVASLLRRSLEHLAAEVPEGYRWLVEELGPLHVEVAVDDEHFAVRGGGGVHVVDASTECPHARVTTSRAAILDLLDGVITLDEAVAAGQLDAIGPLDALLQAHDALIAYVHAAVRAPSVPGLRAKLTDEGCRR